MERGRRRRRPERFCPSGGLPVIPGNLIILINLIKALWGGLPVIPGNLIILINLIKARWGGVAAAAASQGQGFGVRAAAAASQGQVGR